MKIQVNHDAHVKVSAAFRERIASDAEAILDRFAGQLTRVEVHLGDESAGREGVDDIRCAIEARPRGQQPVAVTEHAGAAGAAVSGALEKLEALLEHKFARLADKDGRATIRGGRVGA